MRQIYEVLPLGLGFEDTEAITSYHNEPAEAAEKLLENMFQGIQSVLVPHTVH